MSKKFALLATVLALGVVLAACLPVKPATPEVVSVTLARKLAQDYRPVEETTEFYPTETFNCSVKVSSLPKGSVVKAAWFYGDELLNETTYTAEKAGSGYVGFHLKAEKYWPIGKYRVKVYLNDEFAREAEFSVVPPKEAIPSQVKKVVMAREVDEDKKPVKTTSVFSPDDTIHCSVNADLGLYSRLVARWYYEGQLQENLTSYFVAEENAPDTYVDFYVRPSSPLPEGDYYVEIYLDGNLVHRADFSVKEEIAAPAGMELYSSDSLGFSIFYPSGWDVLEEKDHVTFQASSGLLLTVGVLEEAEGKPQDITESLVEALKGDYPTLETTFSGPYSAAGIDWWEADLTFEDGGVKFSSILLTTVRDGRAYVIVTLAPAEEEENWLGTFVSMVESFRIK